MTSRIHHLASVALIALAFLGAGRPARAQSLYVGNDGNNEIWSYSLSAGNSSAAEFTGTNVDAPEAMVISGGTLYVADESNSEIVAYTASNPTGTVFATASSGLDNPDALAAYGGNLYVANESNSTIESYSLATGSSSAATFASGGDVAGPIGLAVDGSGNLYVGDNSADGIYKYSIASGSASGTLFSNTDVSYPYGMVVSGSNLYAAAYEASAIYSYPLAGGSPTLFASTSGTSELDHPDGLAVDGSGNLYAANYDTYTVEKYALATGSSSATQFASTGVDFPDGIAAGTLLSVPEPSAWFATLAGLGILGVLFHMRRHRRVGG